MMRASIYSDLTIASLGANFLAILRVTQLKLYRTYPFFFVLLSLSIPTQAASVIFGYRSLAVFWCYVIFEPLRNVFFILVVWELFSVIFEDYAGLRTLSRWVMGGAAAVSPLGFIFTLIANGPAMHSLFIRSVVRFERGIAIGVVIFIIAMLYFISRYPIRLPRNSVVLSMLYSICLSRTPRF
jgi:hypothetical protein